jgi:ubiquinone/menaquinone biosynthesis C-methylase UbiE
VGLGEPLWSTGEPPLGVGEPLGPPVEPPVERGEPPRSTPLFPLLGMAADGASVTPWVPPITRIASGAATVDPCATGSGPSLTVLTLRTVTCRVNLVFCAAFPAPRPAFVMFTDGEPLEPILDMTIAIVTPATAPAARTAPARVRRLSRNTSTSWWYSGFTRAPTGIPMPRGLKPETGAAPLQTNGVLAWAVPTAPRGQSCTERLLAFRIARMTGEDYRSASYQIWQAMAAGWDRERSWMWDVSRAVSERMLEALAPEPGQTILELAAGTGETGFAAARVIGPAGRLICTDFAPEMVAAARSGSDRLGLANVEHREMDAERMDLEDDSVDGVLCRWGYMLMADPATALAETRRVLRAGGRLSLSVWGAAERNPWASVPARALREHIGAPAPDPHAPGIFAMSDPDRVRALVRDAGFGEPRLEEVEVSWRFDDFDAYWRYVTQLAGGLAMVLQTMPDPDREAVRTMVEQAVGDFHTDGGLALPGLALNATAR